jgi:selenocysteine lyase/cysteine desulfurase
MDFPIDGVRAKFPALARSHPFLYFDNAAGAQAPQNALDAVAAHLLDFNVQRGGRYEKSRMVDRVIATAREKVASFLNAKDATEICFGMNATSFIRLVSLAIGQTIDAGRDEIIVTDLDHDANIATWLALRSFGVRFAWWRMRDDFRLHIEDLAVGPDPAGCLHRCVSCAGLAGRCGGGGQGGSRGRWRIIRRLRPFRAARTDRY